MTERLGHLLHDEAATLVAPPPPDLATLRDAGRRARRRRDAVGALVAAAAVAAVIGVSTAVVGDTGTRDAQPAGPDTATPAPPAYAAGSEVYVGDHVAEVPDTVHSLHYTSLGVLVRSNPHGGASDGSGPESLTLVRWDGSTTDLGTIPEGVGPATDPARDVYVLAEPRGEGFEAVVRDAATGSVAQTVPLPDLPPSYWEVPPLALDGSRLFVGYRKETAVVDLETGTVTKAAALGGGMPTVNGGRVVGPGSRRALEVLDATSGDTVLSVDIEPDTFPYGTLSPDGRYLRVVSQDPPQAADDVTTVYDVATGEEQEFAGSSGWGWTADGDLFRVAGGTVTRCGAATGDCRDSTTPDPPPASADLRLGGLTYES